MKFLRGVVDQGRVRIAALGDLMIDAPVALPEDGHRVQVGLRP